MAEVRLGANLDDALEALGKRIGVLDFDWTILAIQIQREVGGNLAEILEIISETIREREKLQREIKALTAEGRMSGMVLGLLPVAMALLLFMRSPDYLRPLYTTSKGLTMIGFSSVMMILGFFWMKKIVKIEV
jgi:tight adherence protein B